MDQVDAAGDLADVLDHRLERVAAGVGVAGVEAEADVLRALGGGDGLPDTGDPVEVARHRVVAAGRVLDQERDLDVGRLDRLAPVVEALGRVVVLVDVTAVDDQPLRADLGRGVHVLLEELAARDADPVVRRGHVDDVGRVDIEIDAGLLGAGLESGCALGVGHHRALVGLRVAEEELHQARAARGRLGDGVGLVYVGTDRNSHGPSLGRGIDISAGLTSYLTGVW